MSQGTSDILQRIDSELSNVLLEISSIKKEPVTVTLSLGGVLGSIYLSSYFSQDKELLLDIILLSAIVILAFSLDFIASSRRNYLSNQFSNMSVEDAISIVGIKKREIIKRLHFDCGISSIRPVVTSLLSIFIMYFIILSSDAITKYDTEYFYDRLIFTVIMCGSMLVFIALTSIAIPGKRLRSLYIEPLENKGIRKNVSKMVLDVCERVLISVGNYSVNFSVLFIILLFPIIGNNISEKLKEIDTLIFLVAFVAQIIFWIVLLDVFSYQERHQILSRKYAYLQNLKSSMLKLQYLDNTTNNPQDRFSEELLVSRLFLTENSSLYFIFSTCIVNFDLDIVTNVSKETLLDFLGTKS